MMHCVLMVIPRLLVRVRLFTEPALDSNEVSEETIVSNVSSEIIFKHLGAANGTCFVLEFGLDALVYGSLVPRQVAALVRCVLALVTFELWFCFLVDASPMLPKTHSSSERVRALVALEC